MSNKISVGILGATGMVGQNYISLLENHPWFQVTFLAASPASAGKKYSEAVQGRWLINGEIPESVKDLRVHDANLIEEAAGKCSVVFSAVDMDKKAVAAMESSYAQAGFAVLSNNSAHRYTPDVPMIIPEINSSHADIIPIQKKNHGWDKGFIAVKSNCSIQSYMTPVFSLIQAGYDVRKMFITTLQALSGAGYPGPSALDMIDNIIPFIKGEEEKSEQEPLKILGRIENGMIVNANAPLISAHCNRVPVIHGHTACVSLEFNGEKPELTEIISIWQNFKSVPQQLKLPSAPQNAIVYRSEENRPQPRKDRDSGNGMTVTLGRLRPDNIFDIRFTGLHHNTIRGAAGGCILTAELLKAKGYII
ncbi:MAG TPA: aspartate-semialdehyde dehydrogenase [Chitinispirillaceae bacterium]|nr:aspartate-semialdehyde dehydrogenase [Chitinispirillaceae bacterium]